MRQVTYLDLFRKILNDKDSLPKGDGTKDLLQLIMFLLRKFFKCIEKDPFVIVDALLPKGRGQWQRYSSAKDEDDDGMAGQRSRIREKLAAAELEFIKKNNLSWSQQMGVVVSILVSAEHKEWVRETVAVSGSWSDLTPDPRNCSGISAGGGSTYRWRQGRVDGRG